MRTIGWVSVDPPVSPELQAFFTEALRPLGWVEGADFVYAKRFGDHTLERLSANVAELVQMNCDVIFALGTQASLELKRTTTVIPIVIWAIGDPVADGLATSLARPGGNFTGVSFVSNDLAAKRLQLMKEVLPRLSVVAVLWDTTDSKSALTFRETEAAARTLNIRIQSVELRSAADFDGAFDQMTRQRPGAMITIESMLTFLRRRETVEFASAARLPAIYPFREYADAGGLISYGLDLRAMLRKEAGYIDKILRGAKPADMPIAQPTQFNMVINANTAKALGLTIPQSLLLRADEVIQ